MNRRGCRRERTSLLTVTSFPLPVVIKEVDDKLGLEITYRTIRGKDMAPLRARIVKCLEAGAAAASCELTWRFSDPYVDMWPNLVLGNIFAEYLNDRGPFFFRDSSRKNS